jgi:hypothetical protein
LDKAVEHFAFGIDSSSVALEICMHGEIDEATADISAAVLVAGLLHDLSLNVPNVRTSSAMPEYGKSPVADAHWWEVR